MPQDYVEAVHWYRKAANQGHAKARRALKMMYFRGQGAPLVRWTAIGTILLGLLMLTALLLRSKCARWVRWGLWAALFATVQAHWLLEGLWGRWDDRLLIAMPAVFAVVVVIMEVREALRASKQPPAPPEAVWESLS